MIADDGCAYYKPLGDNWNVSFSGSVWNRDYETLVILPTYSTKTHILEKIRLRLYFCFKKMIFYINRGFRATNYIVILCERPGADLSQEIASINDEIFAYSNFYEPRFDNNNFLAQK